MTMTNLVDNINEKFLVCRLCNEAYKKPKVLTCLHVFCTECLEELFERQNNHGCRYKKPLSCTLCKKKTPIPEGGVAYLQDSFLITNLAATIGRGRVKHLQTLLNCEICKKSKNAESKCIDCSKLLCKSCVKDHRQFRVTSAHCIFDLNKDSSTSINCNVHTEELVKYFCETCSRCICIVCTFDTHKAHNILDFKEALKGKNDELNKLSVICQERMLRAKTQLDTIKQCEMQINEAESCIRYMAIESIAEIRQNERALLKDLHELYGQETADILKRSDKLKDTYKQMQHNTKYNEKYFGTNELLIVQNDMKMQMNDVISGLDLNIPTEMMRRVKVVPVVVKPGELKEDTYDNIMTTKVILIDDNDNNIDTPTLRTIECQTEHVIITQPEDIPETRSCATNTATSSSTSRSVNTSARRPTKDAACGDSEATVTHQQCQTPPSRVATSRGGGANANNNANARLNKGVQVKLRRVSKSISCQTELKCQKHKCTGMATGRQTSRQTGTPTSPYTNNKASCTDTVDTCDAYTTMELVDVTKEYMKAINGTDEQISNINANAIKPSNSFDSSPKAPPRKHKIDIKAVLKAKSQHRKQSLSGRRGSDSPAGPPPPSDRPIANLGKTPESCQQQCLKN